MHNQRHPLLRCASVQVRIPLRSQALAPISPTLPVLLRTVVGQWGEDVIDHGVFGMVTENFVEPAFARVLRPKLEDFANVFGVLHMASSLKDPWYSNEGPKLRRSYCKSWHRDGNLIPSRRAAGGRRGPESLRRLSGVIHGLDGFTPILRSRLSGGPCAPSEKGLLTAVHLRGQARAKQEFAVRIMQAVPTLCHVAISHCIAINAPVRTCVVIADVLRLKAAAFDPTTALSS